MSGRADAWIPNEGVYPPTVQLFIAAAIVVMIVSVAVVLLVGVPLLGYLVPVTLSILFVGGSTAALVLTVRVLGSTQVRVTPKGFEWRRGSDGPIQFTPAAQVTLEVRGNRGCGAMRPAKGGIMYLSPDQFAAASAALDPRDGAARPIDRRPR
jgi:hypothetical protein